MNVLIWILRRVQKVFEFLIFDFRFLAELIIHKNCTKLHFNVKSISAIMSRIHVCLGVSHGEMDKCFLCKHEKFVRFGLSEHLSLQDGF